ncbi:DUF2752 domain-containing protein [Allosaccharopolyspora coralli]|uniref:DUF2752 domain-containing protein n=2 Tax=Allosaccharopolyspora coralli TaxID=2665642 RepID=A0A5Q3QC21_9PSEU|nr:DUF2752 domain-containing protein [Allosaccharopolyspora coralli]
MFPVRRIPRTGLLVLGVGAFGLVLGSGVIPVPCPLKLLTGLDCPLCGGSRVAGALLQADLARALDVNAFAVLVVLPLVAVVLVAMARVELGRARFHWPAGRLGSVLGYVLLGAFLTWGVVRNLPFEPFTVLRA